MPTSYTQNVQDGTITELSDFIKECAFVFIRTDDFSELPEKVEPFSCFKEDFEESVQRLVKYQNMSQEEKEEAWEKAHLKQVGDDFWYKEKKKKIRERYEAMLSQVDNWKVSEELFELKEFMIDQLNTSIIHDCREYKSDYERLPLEDWYQQKIEYHVDRVAEAAESFKNEIIRVRKMNKFLDAVHEAVKNV